MNVVAEFAPDAVVDSWPLTGSDVDAVLPEVPTVVLSSQDVYAAFTGLRTGHEVAAAPITEDSELRAERYPHRGTAVPVPDDYEKLDVEQRWLRHGAVVLRLPMIYGPPDWQRREEPILRRLRAHRRHIPIGAANLLWTRGHVDDLATGVLAAIDNRATDGLAVNLGEADTCTFRGWFSQILAATGSDTDVAALTTRCDHLSLRRDHQQLDLRTAQNVAPSLSAHGLGEDVEVNTEQHERPEEQNQDEVQDVSETGDPVSGTERYYQTNEQIHESAKRNTTPFDDVHDCSSRYRAIYSS